MPPEPQRGYSTASQISQTEPVYLVPKSSWQFVTNELGMPQTETNRISQIVSIPTGKSPLLYPLSGGIWQLYALPNIEALNAKS